MLLICSEEATRVSRPVPIALGGHLWQRDRQSASGLSATGLSGRVDCRAKANLLWRGANRIRSGESITPDGSSGVATLPKRG